MKGLRNGAWLLSCIVIFAAALPAPADVIIQLNYDHDNGFFNPGTPSGQLARSSMTKAATFFQGILADNLTAIVPSGTDTWTASFFNPTNPGNLVEVINPTIAVNTLVVYVGGSTQLGGSLGLGGPGGFTIASGSQQWLDTVQSRGQAVVGDFGPWGGSISFNSTSNWNFNPDASPTSGQSDLYSVVLHEMGHVLGIGTADSWTNNITGSNFTGAASVAEHGGSVPLFSDKAHWAEGTPSHQYFNGPAQEAALDPTLTVGTRKVFTDLDVAGLDDLGWQIKPIPEPSVLVALVGMGLVGVVVYVRRKK